MGVPFEGVETPRREGRKRRETPVLKYVCYTDQHTVGSVPANESRVTEKSSSNLDRYEKVNR